MIKLLLVLTLFGLGCAGLSSNQPRRAPRLYSDELAMETELQQYIKVGDGINDAKAVMERSGFKCVELEFWLGRKCLKCSAVHKTLTAMVSRPCINDVVYVYIDHDSSVVTKVSVRCESVGP